MPALNAEGRPFAEDAPLVLGAPGDRRVAVRAFELFVAGPFDVG